MSILWVSDKRTGAAVDCSGSSRPHKACALYFDHFDTVVLLSADAIYASDGGVILTVDTATGELRQLTDNADYDLAPLAFLNVLY